MEIIKTSRQYVGKAKKNRKEGEQMFKNIDRYKAEIDALHPIEDFRSKQIKDYFKIKLTYSSNVLEGNSLTGSEIKEILENGSKIDENRMWDYYDVVGHAKAYDYLYDIVKYAILSEEHIKTLHRLLYSLVDADVGTEQGGTYRTQRIQVSGSDYPTPTPEKIPPLMLGFVKWLVHNEDKLHPVEFAARAHKELDCIHPFMDENRRVERLLMNLCLIRKGYPVTSISLDLRDEYIMLLEKAHSDDKPFTEFIAARVEEAQQDLIKLLKNDFKII